MFQSLSVCVLLQAHIYRWTPEAEISQNSQENTCARVSHLIKLQAWPVWYSIAKKYKYK